MMIDILSNPNKPDHISLTHCLFYKELQAACIVWMTFPFKFILISLVNAGIWLVKTNSVFVLEPNTSSFRLCPKWFLRVFLAITAQPSSISDLYFSSSNVFFVASAIIRLWCSTVAFLKELCTAVICVSIFSYSFIIKFSSISTQKTLWGSKIWYLH